jgi:hypothetical protein
MKRLITIVVLLILILKISQAQANLTPYQPAGWDNKIVLSTVTGTNTSASSIYSDQTIYLDWAVAYNGSVNISQNFNNFLEIDGECYTDSIISGIKANSLISIVDVVIGPLSAGSHTFKIVVDALNSVTETNETDNQYSRTITILQCTVPAKPSLSGPFDLCKGSSESITATWSIPPVSGATSYTWTLPPGWSGSSTSTSIIAILGPDASSGTITVTANNSCGTSTPCTKSIVLASKPTITTSSVSTLSSSTATGGGNITSDGGAGVTVSGVCWNISSDPTTSDAKTTDGTTTGSFTSTITGLAENVTYYIRAYATNCSGTGYGSNIEYNNSNVIEVIQSTKISIYPNPVSGRLNIEYKNGTYKSINIINPLGILLKTEKVVSPRQQVDFSKFEYGLYILEFVTPGGEIERVRVIKR